MILAILTLVSKGFGFIREMIMANYYGTSFVVDSLNLSYNIPHIIFTGIFSAMATSFIPLYSEKIEKLGDRSANLFTSQLINLLVIVSIISSLVGILFSEGLVTFFTMPETAAPEGSGIAAKALWFATHGWTGEKAALAAFYVKLTFSYALFNTIAGILESLLKYKNIFIRPLLASYGLNIASICVIFFAFRSADPRLLAIGGIAGAVIRFSAVAILVSRKKRFQYKLDFRMSDTVRRMFVLALPIFIGTTVVQINNFVSVSIASGLPTGSIAALSYSNLLVDICAGMTGSIIYTVLYPKLARAFSLEDESHFTYILVAGISVIVIIGLPLTMGALLYSDDLVQIVFERGAFDVASTSLTSIAFFYYAPGLIFNMQYNFLTGTFHSRQDMKTPLFVSITVVAANIASNLILVRFLAHGGLALGNSISFAIGVILLLIMIRRKGFGLINRAFAKKCFKVLLAAIAAVGSTWFFFIGVRALFAANAWILPRTVLLGLTVLLAAGIYLLLLRRLRIPELIHIKEIFRST